MQPHYLPATARDDVPAWQQTVVAFLAEKERRSGSRRTVDTYARCSGRSCSELVRRNSWLQPMSLPGRMG